MMDWDWDPNEFSIMKPFEPEADAFGPAVWTASFDLEAAGATGLTPELEKETAFLRFGDGESGLKPSARSAEGFSLFFEEADALFGKRAEARDASDRYSGAEAPSDDAA